MSKQKTKADTYRLEVSDFGPIVEANVEMRPLTVFVGPSNTGKSYLAILLYALHQSLQGSRFYAQDRWLFSRKFYEWGRRRIHKADTEVEQSLSQWLNPSKKEKGSPIPDSVTAFVKKTLQENVGMLKDRLLSELCRCFGVEGAGTLVRRHSKASHIGLVIPSDTSLGEARIDLKIGRVKANISSHIPNAVIVKSSENLNNDVGIIDHELQQRHGHPDFNERMLAETLELITARVGRNLFDATIDRHSYYLPADRTGIMHAHQALVSTLIQRSARAGIHRSDAIPALSGVLADFLDQLIRIGQRRANFGKSGKGGGESVALAERMEQEILTGGVQMNRSESGYPYFNYKPKGWKNNISLMRSSSMVSELAPVVLYLRHLVLPRDILIIEEPESHLHPEMQAAFARQIALLVQAGIRVILTTHSEWLLDQFANLVRLSDLPESKRKRLPGGSEALHPSQFGAWLFKPRNRPKGSIVEERKVDSDAGGLVADFTDTAEQLYNTWSEVGNLTRETKANSK